jgi:hypothetical protein
MKTLPIIIAVCIALNCWSQGIWATPFAVINEVLYDGPGSDADDVFTELFGTPGLVLDGWSLAGTNGGNGSVYRTVDLTGGVIPIDGIFLIATADTVLGGVDLFANVDWQNGPDSIQLLDAFDSIVDALQYGDAGGFNAGEGLPAADAGAGQSLSRDLFATDTNDNLADFTVLASPTPGTGPHLATVPEPGSLLLMTPGLLCLLLSSLARCRQTGRPVI